MYDVFISHASEDKKSFVEPLANALRQKGLKVWYDKYELKIGNSLFRTIDQGLANSRYGIVVLSPAFFRKQWTNAELDALMAWEMEENREILLPICHNISTKEIRKYSPILAGKCTRKSTSTLDKLVKEIVDLCKGCRNKRIKEGFGQESEVIHQAILSARGIQNALDTGKLVIKPEPTRKLEIGMVSPFSACTVDLRLDGEIVTMASKNLVIDLSKTGELASLIANNSKRYTLTSKKPYRLQKGESILCRTVEQIELKCDEGPPYLAARVEAKISRARLGMLCLTNSLIEPGFKGCLFLQMINLGIADILLYPEMSLVSMHFFRIDNDL